MNTSERVHINLEEEKRRKKIMMRMVTTESLEAFAQQRSRVGFRQKQVVNLVVS